MFLRYLSVAALGYAVDMGIFLVILYLGLAAPVIATVVAKIIAGLFGFLTQRKFTFGVDKEGRFGRQASSYFSLLTINVFAASGILAFFLLFISHPAIAKFLADVVCLIFSYYLSKHFIFTVRTN